MNLDPFFTECRQTLGRHGRWMLLGAVLGAGLVFRAAPVPIFGWQAVLPLTLKQHNQMTVPTVVQAKIGSVPRRFCYAVAARMQSDPQDCEHYRVIYMRYDRESLRLYTLGRTSEDARRKAQAAFEELRARPGRRDPLPDLQLASAITVERAVTMLSPLLVSVAGILGALVMLLASLGLEALRQRK